MEVREVWVFASLAGGTVAVLEVGGSLCQQLSFVMTISRLDITRASCITSCVCVCVCVRACVRACVCVIKK